MVSRSSVRSGAPAAILALVLVVSGGLVPGSTPAARAQEPSCETGWEPLRSTQVVLQDVRTLGPDAAVAVGGLNSTVERHIASLWWDGDGWELRDIPDATADEGLMSVTGSRPGQLWAMGYSQLKRTSGALALKWTGDGWVRRSPPRPRSGGETISAVDLDDRGDVWAVGMSASGVPVRRAIAWRYTASGWRRQSVGAGPGTGFTAVLARASDDVWAAGSQVTRLGIRPLVMRWDGARWRTVSLPPLETDAFLTGLAGRDGVIWAIGAQVKDGELRPLVLRRDGDGWAVEPGPELGGAFAMLTDISVDVSGRLWVVGTSYRDATSRYVPMAARLEETGWQIWPVPDGTGRWASAIGGDPSGDGWIVGRAQKSGFLRKVCEPVPPAPSGRRARRDGSRFGGRIFTVEDDPGWNLPRPVRGLPKVAPLPRATVPRSLVVRDIAADVGLGGDVQTHGASIGDLDGDGRDDIFLSQHGQRASMWLRVAGRYEKQPQEQFRQFDRHGCDIGRVDPGPLPDIVCAAGADGGMGIKSNELWLDPGTGASNDVAATSGVTDPVGRGREVALFDADEDGDQDLLLANLSLRYDALPSPTRLLLNDGTGRFTWDPDSGLTSDRGAVCVLTKDYDRDGDTDLVLCGYTSGVYLTGGLVIYRNDGGRFTNVTRSLGVKPIGEVDAVVSQLGGSARPDLVQLSTERIRISLWSGSRFEPVYERSVVNGLGLAVGDVDGDGDHDLYLQRGSKKVNNPDLILLNGGSGRTWTPIAVPSTSRGIAEDVVAFDHDRDGRTDFLVLNGWMAGGPMNLITVRRAPSAR